MNTYLRVLGRPLTCRLGVLTIALALFEVSASADEGWRFDRVDESTYAYPEALL